MLEKKEGVFFFLDPPPPSLSRGGGLGGSLSETMRYISEFYYFSYVDRGLLV